MKARNPMLFLDEAECGGAGRGGESPGVEDVVDEVDAFVVGTAGVSAVAQTGRAAGMVRQHVISDG